MHDASLIPTAGDAATRARCGSPFELAAALQASRADTLATFAALERARPGLAVPLRPELNPPLWELGHVGWFQAWWIARNPARAQGTRADPDAPRRPAGLADALYDSSRVAHDTRWSLPLPDAAQTRHELAAQLAETLDILERMPRADASDDELYFFRLALLHEDMHHEAALYMAQGLGSAVDDPRWQPRPLAAAPALPFEACTWRLGSAASAGFAFDNELAAHERSLAPFEIDAQVLRWAEYLPFVEDGGYRHAAWWSEPGWRWRHEQGRELPRCLRREGTAWYRWQHGRWQPLDPGEAACHLTRHEAQAWCRWAGRRLPDEAEWECAALTRPADFAWGEVWEWTASPFAAYPGFVPHPYRDYSSPWFDGRPVLRGASFMTQPRLRHPRYRNFFPAWRDDVPAGFRSCALRQP